MSWCWFTIVTTASICNSFMLQIPSKEFCSAIWGESNPEQVQVFSKHINAGDRTTQFESEALEGNYLCFSVFDKHLKEQKSLYKLQWNFRTAFRIAWGALLFRWTYSDTLDTSRFHAKTPTTIRTRTHNHLTVPTSSRKLTFLRRGYNFCTTFLPQFNSIQDII